MPQVLLKRKLDFIFGFHAVLAALKNPLRNHCALYVTPNSGNTLQQKLLNMDPTLSETAQKILKIIPPQQFQSLVKNSHSHQGILLQTSPLPPLTLQEILQDFPGKGIILILDGVTDPQNSGAILRSAAALNVRAVVTTHHHSPDQTGIFVKAASGAIECIPYIKVANLVQAISSLKKHQFWCYGFTEAGKKRLDEFIYEGRVALIFGSEGEGLRKRTEKNCDALVFLPTHDYFTTLNVSNAVAIGIYEVSKQLGLFA